MPRMCQKFLASVLSAALIYGSDAACKTQAEIEALNAALPQKVSEACRLTLNMNSEPPQCGENAKVCGLLVSVETSLNCTGPAVSCTAMNNLMQTDPTPMPVPQTCFPDACINDEASLTAYKDYIREATQAMACQSSEATMASMQDLKSLNVSLELVMTAAEPKMSCDKNADGDIVIDGVTIPLHQDSDKDEHAHEHEHEHTDAGSSSSGSNSGSGSLTTCGDVKKAYKAAGCCGNPQKGFTMMNGDRRLSEQDELLESVKAELRRAEAKGGATAARALAKSIDGILTNFAA